MIAHAVLVAALAAAATPPSSVAEAKRSLDAARSKVVQAIERIRADPPAAPDLDAAAAAIESLKVVLDAGAAHEPQDLEYARAVLAARKEIRGWRELVAARRQALEAHRLEQEVAQSAGRIEERRSALGAAMGPLQGEQISEAQFTQAEQAAAALAAQLEQARPLGARHPGHRALIDKTAAELRQHHKRIEAAWTAANLARLKAELDPPTQDLIRAAKALRQRKAAPEELAELRTAAIVVRKLLERSQPLTAKSQAFAAYAAQVRRSLLEVEVELGRRAVEAAREELARAMAKVAAKDADEGAFGAAAAAVAAARQVLAQAAHLAKEDRGYASYALEVEKRLGEAEAKIAARRVEGVVAKQRADLAAAKTEVQRTVANLERRAPSDEQFAEANTAAIVLEKTLEAATAKDEGLLRLVAELRALAKTARATIDRRRIEVDVEAQRAQIEAGRGAIAAALTQIAGREVPEERLVAADQAIARVQQLLAASAPLAGKDRGYQTYHREVNKRLEEARAKVSARRDELAVEAQQAKVRGAQQELARALAGIDGFGPKAAAIAAADSALEAARAALAAGAALETRLRIYAGWAKDAKRDLAAAEAKLDQRKVELASTDGRALLDAILAKVNQGVERAGGPAAGDAEVAGAEAAGRELREALARSAGLEKQDPAYAAHAAKAKKALQLAGAQLDFAKRCLALRNATLVPLGSGSAAAARADAEPDLRKQKALYQTAVADLGACLRNGERALESDPELARAPLLLEGKSSEPKAVLAACGERLEEVQQAQKKVLALLAFEEGPKAHYERGKELLAAKKTSQALPLFEECISSGKILQFKSPELKDRTFVAGGEKTTLPALIDACTEHARRIRGK